MEMEFGNMSSMSMIDEDVDAEFSLPFWDDLDLSLTLLKVPGTAESEQQQQVGHHVISADGEPVSDMMGAAVELESSTGTYSGENISHESQASVVHSAARCERVADGHAVVPELQSMDDAFGGSRPPPEKCSDRDVSLASPTGTGQSVIKFEHVLVDGHEIQVGPKALEDLRGSTSSASRRMSLEERAAMLMRRKVRNRESAKRSRVKRMETVEVLHEELTCLSRSADRLRKEYEILVETNSQLQRQNNELRKALW